MASQPLRSNHRPKVATPSQQSQLSQPSRKMVEPEQRQQLERERELARARKLALVRQLQQQDNKPDAHNKAHSVTT
jgi:hypothetical protein